jgi:cytochrome c-type biogenesis protein CcmH/NrfG
VVVFGVHSLIDWTWFIPGTAVPALLCAGWLAARGPQAERLAAAGGPGARLRAGVRSPWRVLGAVLVLAIAGTAAYAATRPQAAVDRTDDALAALAAGREAQARTLALEAGDIDPLSVEPLFALAETETAAGNPAAARAALRRAVRLQPGNATAWVRLASAELEAGNATAALRDVRPALWLDPRSRTGKAVYLAALRESQGERAERRR